MAVLPNRLSGVPDRAATAATPKKEIWSSLLDSVASEKRLPQKNVIVLGGTPQTQKGFLESLSNDKSGRRQQGRQQQKQPPLANNFALGYTYNDVLDSDGEDTLAQISTYLLADPSPSFSPLLRPLLTPETIPHTIIVVLLDWSEPWLWLRQLKEWLTLMMNLVQSLPQECQDAFQDAMKNMRNHSRGTDGSDGSGDASSKGLLPLGPGEWDMPLGLPLCVVCQSADQMEAHERERSWGNDDFDFVMQTMRTILLKHGASLIYTTPNVKSELQPLVESLLGINTLLKRHSIKHNVVDRDRILVPTNWDSWGKIRVLREGFDVEQVSKGWATDLEEYDPTNSAESTLKFYEETIKDSHADSGGSLSAPANLSADALEVHSEDSQRFLAAQLALLEKLKAEDEEAERKKKGERGGAALVESAHDGDGQTVERRLNEHIGPYQFNLGGIQVDVDDAENAIQSIKDRQSHQSTEPETQDERLPNNEQLKSFFDGLLKKSNGGRDSPK